MISPSSRMLQMLSLLQAKRDWPSSVLAERLGVSVRTIRRDVDRLRELGYQITAMKGPDGGYRINAGSELPPLLFDDEQAVALAIALQGAAGTGVDITDAAQRALATVRQVMPSHLRHRIDSIALESQNAESSEQTQSSVLEIVSSAVRNRMMLRFSYSDGTAETRHIAPHGIATRGQRWYVIAWEPAREQWRLFRLDRMTLRSTLGPRFEPRVIPTGDAESFVDATLKGSDHENKWPCTAIFEIDLPLRDVLPWISDGHSEAVSEHRTRVTIGSWSWMGALASIIRFDASFRIIAPPELIGAAQSLTSRLNTVE